jgi:hypothetical protein
MIGSACIFTCMHMRAHERGSNPVTNIQDKVHICIFKKVYT